MSAHRWHRIRVIPPAWVGKPGFMKMAYYVWGTDPSWAHEYALKRTSEGASCLIEPTNEPPPWGESRAS